MRTKKWWATEREVCQKLGAEHVGGPGQPDCRLDAYMVEVKDHGKPIGLTMVRSTYEKSWAQGHPLIMVSTSGYTRPAVEFAAGCREFFLYYMQPGGRIVSVWPPAEEQAPRDACSRPNVLGRVVTVVVAGVVVLVTGTVAAVVTAAAAKARTKRAA